MSQQPRRRRRRRRGRGQGQQRNQNQEAAPQRSAESKQQPQSEGGPRRRRRGRKRSRGGGERDFTPAKSSEDIVRAPKGKRPDTLTLPPDERRLEEIIGSLQSEMGVPQNPQEYRLTIKVAEERDSRPKGNRSHETKDVDSGGDGKPKREKAPAAPRVGGSEGPGAERDKGPARRRRSRRRRRGGRGGRGGHPAGGGAPSS